MSLSNNKNVALSARNIFGVAALAGRASSVRFPVSLKFHRAMDTRSYSTEFALAQQPFNKIKAFFFPNVIFKCSLSHIELSDDLRLLPPTLSSIVRRVFPW